MSEATETMVHPFEARGLGKAPFRFVGMQYQEISYGMRVVGSAGGIPIMTRPGGTCDYCHHAILDIFNVESADGNRFHVGCDCIRKVDAKLAVVTNAALKEHRRKLVEMRITAAKEALPQAQGLKSQPHPSPYHAEQGKTMWDYCNWLLTYGGKTSQLSAARRVEKALSPIDYDA